MRVVSILGAVAAVVILGCGGAHRSRWQTNAPAVQGQASDAVYMVCACKGTERQPTPSEAANFREGERVDLFCEGEVHDCHSGQLWPAHSPRNKSPINPYQQLD